MLGLEELYPGTSPDGLAPDASDEASREEGGAPDADPPDGFCPGCKVVLIGSYYSRSAPAALAKLRSKVPSGR